MNKRRQRGMILAGMFAALGIASLGGGYGIRAQETEEDARRRRLIPF